MIKTILSNTLLFGLLLISLVNYSQTNTGELFNLDKVNTITTAVPFLLIAPESRGSAMADVGAATSPDVNSLHYNPAKFAFIKEDFGASLSYSPWLSRLIDDINLLYFTGYFRISKNQVIASSIRYFSLGNITFTDIVGNVTGNYNPREFAFDLAYSRKLSKKLSSSIALRYIYSDLTGGQFVQGTESHAGKSLAFDISTYYQDYITILNKKSKLAFGLNISNIGSKISYTQNAQKDFIPANLKIGACFTTEVNEYHRFAFAFDVNKLLVPTSPLYANAIDEEGNPIIEYGMDPNVSVFTAMHQSFYDAPGVLNSNGQRSVLHEEFREINYSLGIEYSFDNMLFFRAGYFFEHPTKGNREFFTVGVGGRCYGFGLDISYLLPTQQRHPLENTIRFTLKYDFNRSSYNDMIQLSPI